MWSRMDRLRWATALAMLLLAAPGWASVLMNGTRVIVSGGARDKTVQFTNTGDEPRMVQIWVSREPGGRAEQGGAFVVMPPIFRMGPHRGQTVRLLAVPEQLAQDREALFYLNFSQYPATVPEQQDRNQLMLVVKSTVKLLHRPPAVPQRLAALPEAVRVSWHADGLRMENPTPLHINVLALQIGSTERLLHLPLEPTMVSPFTTWHWQLAEATEEWAATLRQALATSGVTRCRVTVINDYGAEVTTEVTLRFP